MDYNLSGLSARSFEQLIQSLALKILGIGTTVFGDGPDGGREAAIDAVVPYPTNEENWSGYIVIQAKFRQMPGDGKDVDWLASQIQKELKIYNDKRRRLRKPEYYILATNIKLSSIPQIGGKDKISRVFDANAKWGVKGLAVWDFDQLQRFIEADESVRTAYAAWITPGDVLSAVMKSLAPKAPDFSLTISNFIQKEFLADMFVNLEQAGHTTPEKTSLSRVFVDVPVGLAAPNSLGNYHRKDDLLFLRWAINLGDQRLTASLGASNEASETQEPGRVVLVGGPGQGKTTVGQFLAQAYRASILSSRQDGLERQLRDAIADFRTQCAREKLNLPAGRRFPIRIVLNSFAKEIGQHDGPRSLMSYLVRHIAKKASRKLDEEDFRGWLAVYPWIIILDGLDEVPSSSNREQVLSLVKEFWIDVRDAKADVLVIATTRPQGYSNDFSEEVYKHIYLQPLTAAQALHYAERLVVSRYEGDTSRRERIIERLKIASEGDATRRLMTSPLQVTIMTTLVDQIGKPPQDRWRLFQKYYDVIYNREMSRDMPAAVLLRDHKPDVDVIHQWLGLTLQVESERVGGTDARITFSRLEAVVRSRLSDEGYKGQALKGLLDLILEAASDRLVFVVGLQADAVGFEIRSLQEFMAAEALMDGPDTAVHARLTALAPLSNWRNVFLFMAGKCFADRQHLRSLLLAVCVELSQSADRTIKIGKVAPLLALDILEDGAARRQPTYSCALATLALDIMSQSPNRNQERLAHIYDESLEEVFRDKITPLLNHRSYGAWVVVSILASADIGWAKSLANEIWPMTIDERLELWRAISPVLEIGIAGKWWSDRSVELLPYFTVSDWDIVGEFAHDEDLQPLFPISKFIFQNEGSRIPINESAKVSCWISYRSVGKGDTARLAAEIHFETGIWNGFHMIRPFLNNPNAQTLAAALGRLASLDTRTSLPIQLPWPLQIILDLCESIDDLAQASEFAEQGVFGDYQDWMNAEARWNGNGLTFADLFGPTFQLKPEPFDLTLLATPSLIFLASPSLNAAKLVNDLSRCILDQPLTKRVARIGKITLSLFFPFVSEARDKLDFKSILKVNAQTQPPQPIPLELVFALFSDILDPPSDSLLDLLDGCIQVNGVQSDGYFYRRDRAAKSATDIVLEIEKAYYRAPRRIGFLRLLALLATEQHRLRPNLDLDDVQQFKELESVQSGLMLIAATLSDRGVKIERFVHAIAEVMTTKFLPRLLSALGNSKQSPQFEPILWALYEVTVDRFPSVVLQISIMLRDKLRERPSDLHNVGSWQEMALPVALGRCLTTDPKGERNR